MKRTALVAVASLILGIASAQAGATGTPKTYEGSYSATAPGGCGDGGGHHACAYAYDCKDAKSGCALVQLKRPASNVQIEIVDQTALPVLARVYAYGGSKPIAILCGSPQESFPVDVGGATELLVHIVAGTCEDSTPSTPTTGVVRVTRI